VNLGIGPRQQQQNRALLEIHLLDFDAIFTVKTSRCDHPLSQAGEEIPKMSMRSCRQIDVMMQQAREACQTY